VWKYLECYWKRAENRRHPAPEKETLLLKLIEKGGSNPPLKTNHGEYLVSPAHNPQKKAKIRNKKKKGNHQSIQEN